MEKNKANSASSWDAIYFTQKSRHWNKYRKPLQQKKMSGGEGCRSFKTQSSYAPNAWGRGDGNINYLQCPRNFSVEDFDFKFAKKSGSHQFDSKFLIKTANSQFFQSAAIRTRNICFVFWLGIHSSTFILFCTLLQSGMGEQLS